MTELKIESSDLSLSDLYKDFYAVPDFQREYVWETENVEKLLNDIHDEFYDERGLVHGSPEYFIGSIVACKDNKGVFQLIDGQQRMTTTYLVLCAIRDTLKKFSAESKALAEMIHAVSSDARTGEDVEQYRLVLQYEDSHDILELIASGNPPASLPSSATASMRNIKNAYQDVCEFLTANFESAAQLKEFFAAFTQRVKLIRILTPSLTHALKVFETINDRGVGLNAMDLLKNLLFMRTKPEQYQKLKGRWKELVDTIDGCKEKPLRFLRYFILSSYDTDTAKPLREDEIYAWFSANADAIGITVDPLAFIGKLVDRAKAYANFTAARNRDSSPNRYLKNIALLSGAARQHFILLLAAQHLETALFERLSRDLENLFFVYIITREPTKNFERNFAKWSADLRAVDTDDGLQAFYEKHIAADIADRSNAFDFAFQELSLWRLQQYRMKYILAKLTQHIEERAWGNPAHTQLDHYITNSVHIEHVLAQSPPPQLRESFDAPEKYDEYAQRLGNLTLLERTINASISNGSYEAKSPGYRQSSFLLTKSLVEKPSVGANTQLNSAVKDLKVFDEWNSQAIEARQQMLGDLARQVWNVETSLSEELAPA